MPLPLPTRVPSNRSDPPADPRGVRFAAAVTTAVLAAVLLTSSAWLLAAQTAVFALAAFAGLRFAPYSVAFRTVVAPRLGPPTGREDAAPVRFSQLVGFVFTAVGLVGLVAGLPALGLAATALALVAAFLNAAFGYCLGCELYGLVARLTTKGASALRSPGGGDA